MENTEKLNMQTTDVHPGKGMPSGPLADMNLMDDLCLMWQRRILRRAK